MKLFGYEIIKASELEKKQSSVVRSFVTEEPDDGSKDVGLSGLAATYGTSMNLDKLFTSQSQLVNEYRSTAMIPDVDLAIEDIVSESIVYDDDTPEPVKLNLNDTPLKPNVQKIIEEEFKYVLGLLKFPYRAHDIYKRWYIDGQLNYHKLIDEVNPSEGIQELRFVDPRNLIKVRSYPQPQNMQAGQGEFSALKPENYVEYWLYSEEGFTGQMPSTVNSNTSALSGIKIASDAIAHCNSGLIDPTSKMILSHLHKAVRIARQLRMIEDSMIIYRVTHCVERRIIKVGIPSHIAKGRSEQYMQQFVARYKNKLTYDPNTGDIRDERKHWSAVENIFIPVWDGDSGSEVTTLPGAENLGVVSDVELFQQKLFRALNVPLSRLDPETTFTLGRTGEITRDEVKYSRFISRLRSRFSGLFDDLLGSQLILKGILDADEWEAIRYTIHYDFTRDNHFTELMEAEILMNRINVLNGIDPFVGKYFSTPWVKKNILRQSEEEIEEMEEEMEIDFEQQLQMQEAEMQMQSQFMPPPAAPKPKPKISAKKNLKEEVEEEPKSPSQLDELLKTLTEEARGRLNRRRNLRILPGTGE